MTDSYVQVYDNELNAVKGAWGSGLALEKTLSCDEVDGLVVKGRVVSIDPTTRKWVLGCSAGRIPWFTWDGNGVGQFDVRKVPGGVGGGRFVALCSLGNYELWTTEWSGTGSAFVPNTPLAVDNTAGANLGKIKVTTLTGGLDFCGFVTCGDNGEANPRTNEYQKTVVQFLSTWQPIRA